MSVKRLYEHSFTVYLLHDFVKKQIVNPLNLTGSPIIAYGMNFLLTLAISIILAIFVDTILIRPLQKSVRKILN